MRTVLVIVVVAGLGAAAAALAMEPMGSVEDGRRLALDVCAQCHVVAETQRPPRPPVPNVPSFFALADEPRITEFYLRSFFRTPHRVMPNFMLTADEIDNIVVYIFSLKERKKK